MTCPACGSAKTSSRGAAAGFQLRQCDACELVWTDPQPNAEDLAKCYAEDYWEAPANGRGIVARLQQKFIETRMIRGLRPLVSRLTSGHRVLDVGCGSGEALRLMSRAGCTAYGVEASPSAAEQARSGGATIFNGSIAEAAHANEFFDGVTIMHVLEHVRDPRATLAEVHRIIKPGGLLLIEVPNIASWGFAIFRRRWRALDVPRHLFHFSPRSLTRLLSRSGFDVLRLSHFSARTSAAMWVGSLFTSLDPVLFRQREASGRSALPQKLAYLFLQMAVLPIVALTASARRGDVISVLARKIQAQMLKQ